MDLMRSGARTLFRGARRGSAPLTGVGAALVALGWVRRIYRPPQELIYSRKLRRGESLRIRLLGAQEDAEGELDVSG